MTTLRSDINTGNTRDCQAAIEDLGESQLELEESDVPANYVVRLRSEQAGLRKSILRAYHIQREQFLPSARQPSCSPRTWRSRPPPSRSSWSRPRRRPRRPRATGRADATPD